MSFLSRRAVLLATPALLLAMPFAGAEAALPATPRATEGPFYPTKPPADDDSDLVRVEGAVREAGGEILHLGGRLLDRNARPIAAARVEIWQCDANGIYLHPGDRRRGERDTAFQGFGHALSDAEGRFGFRTIVPVPYSGRTPHIHVKLWRNDRAVLTTQLYRAGFPQNATDFLFRRLSPEEQERVSMTLAPLSGAESPTFEAEVQIVLAS
ncbi:MAG: hypothetical protein ACREDZ_12815 [Kiloniellales bacterium]